MAILNIIVVNHFTTNAISWPTIPKNMYVTETSMNYLRIAPFGVAFTGVVNFKTGYIYLHPLAADPARGNTAMVSIPLMHHNSAGLIDGHALVNPIFHPNLSAQGRAMANQTSGHHKICEKYNLNQEDCIGFALTKHPEYCKFTTNSKTLNSDKFLVPNSLVGGCVIKNPYLAALVSAPTNSDGQLNKEWAYEIAATLERFYSPKVFEV